MKIYMRLIAELRDLVFLVPLGRIWARITTVALATVAMPDAVRSAEMLDVVGYNHQEPRYAADQRQYPKRSIYGSENGRSWAQWLAVRDNDYVGGQFLRTGIDYLGVEPQASCLVCLWGVFRCSNGSQV